MSAPRRLDDLAQYPLLDALRNRRSRRFALGMTMPAGPLAYHSRHAPLPLSEEEEAWLVFAACGVTGYALGDLPYAAGQGGTILAGTLGRTIASGDAIQTTALVVSNDAVTYLIKRPQDFAREEIAELVALAGQNAFPELYRRSRIRLHTGRVAPPKQPIFNINVNAWSAYAPGTTYFLPLADLTYMYINALLDVLDETTGAYILDERAHFQPAGLGRFARSKGGHLDDNPRAERVSTVQRVEALVSDFVALELGAMLQNLGLMAQAIGVGGFPNFAAHDYGWARALGFRMRVVPASHYLGVGPLTGLAMRLLRQDFAVPYPLGLEQDGTVLLKPYCPPYYASMGDAVRAVVSAKLGPGGALRGAPGASAWADPAAVSAGIPALSETAIAATIAYCEYIYRRYGRFPAYLPPIHTISGFQAGHLDTEFYDHFYRPEALSATQRAHQARWHSDAPPA
jgi:hypothetical protein